VNPTAVLIAPDCWLVSVRRRRGFEGFQFSYLVHIGSYFSRMITVRRPTLSLVLTGFKAVAEFPKSSSLSLAFLSLLAGLHAPFGRKHNCARAMCSLCGFPGTHPSAFACIHLLRARIAELEFKARASFQHHSFTLPAMSVVPNPLRVPQPSRLTHRSRFVGRGVRRLNFRLSRQSAPGVRFQ
jgi:hypothetical protein